MEQCVKSVRIQSFSGPYFPAFGLNTNQENCKSGHFSRIGTLQITLEILVNIASILFRRYFCFYFTRGCMISDEKK